MKVLKLTEFENLLIQEVMREDGSNLLVVWHKRTHKTDTSYYSIFVFIEKQFYDITNLAKKYGGFRLNKNGQAIVSGAGYNKVTHIIETTLTNMGLNHKDAWRLSERIEHSM